MQEYLQAQVQQMLDTAFLSTLQENPNAPLFPQYNRSLRIKNDRTKRSIQEEYQTTVQAITELARSRGIQIDTTGTLTQVRQMISNVSREESSALAANPTAGMPG